MKSVTHRVSGCLLLAGTFIAVFTDGAWGAAPEAGERNRTGGSYEIRIKAEEDRGRITFEADGLKRSISFDMDIVQKDEGEIQIDDLRVAPDGIHVSGRTFSLDGLRIGDLYEDDDVVFVVLRRRSTQGASSRIAVRRDRLAVGRSIRVDHDDFVRGDVICFGGNVTVAGEVNHDVIALFGSVHVENSGIVQGDVAAIDGRVSLRGEGCVRGRVFTPRGVRDARHRQWFRDEDWIHQFISMNAHYNRVDGFHLGALLRAADADSVLPTLYAGGGYAFVAERWRYRLGVRQRFGDAWAFALGGSFFRRTATDDDWLSSEDESSTMAVLFAEDFRDYYQEEGGRGHLTIHPGWYNEIGVSYAYAELGWMDHHPKLWSLFGWDKEFRANFSSVPAAERRDRMDEFDTKLGELITWYTLDTRDDDIDPWQGWWGRLEYRKAGGNLKGDHEYERFTAELRRFQPLGHRIGFNARIKYGTSEGELPLMRAFYLGGLRTIRSLRHKSLRGEQMILGNAEYVIETGFLDARTALFFDIGKLVTREQDVFKDGEFSSAVGLRLILEDELQVEVAKSLDDMDEAVRAWVMLERTF